MFESKKSQNAGDNSTQVQAEKVVVIQQGISEERVRAIFDEKLAEALEKFSSEAQQTAQNRIYQFSNILIPKLVKQQLLESFSDPCIQILLLSAQRTAASTERLADYELLSELLIHRVKRRDDRNTRAGVSRAVQIVDEISDEALLGLTVAHSIGSFLPVTGDIDNGLDALDTMFSKLLYGNLPNGITWLEQLEALNAVRISSFGKLKPCSEIYEQNLAGYIDAGIKKSSENYKKALEILAEAGLSAENLVDHAMCDGYVRLNIANIDAVRNLSITEEQQKALRDIYGMYDDNVDLKQNNKNIFLEHWNRRESLKTIEGWWDNLSMAFAITLVGRILAHANAQRCDSSLPNLDY